MGSKREVPVRVEAAVGREAPGLAVRARSLLSCLCLAGRQDEDIEDGNWKVREIVWIL